MQIKRIVILMLILLSSIQGFSQKSRVVLNGVIFADNGQPTEGVSVAFKGTNYAALTNANGEYEITAEPGNYTLVVNFVGYKSKQTKINLQSNQTAPSITIEEDMAALDEVQVVGKSKVERVREQPFNIAAIDLKKTYNQSTDLNQVLATTTGVRVRETGGMGSDFKFSLNGFSGNQVKFFMDGIPIDSYGSSFTLNNIPVNMAERIEVYKGVVPVELGSDALGGAVNIITNQSVKRYIDASYSFGSFNTHRVAVNTRFTSKNGFVSNINAFGNYTDNSYKVSATTSNPDGTFNPEREYKHFHDGYKSGAIIAEFGVKGKKYADYLLIGMMASANKKEIQTGSTMQRVVGEAFNDSKAFVPSLKFKKDSLFTKNLSVNFIASYNIVQSRSVDTSSYRYQWDGSRTPSVVSNSGGELNDEKTIYVYDDNSFQANTNFKYDLNERQYFAFNYSVNTLKRKEDDEVRTITKPGSPIINKNILGLSYNLAAFDRKLSVIAFGKKYFLNTEMNVLEYINGSNVYISLKSSFDDIGYGTALAYFVTSDIQLKTSFEHAYRLPTGDEMLGDGLNLKPAPTLKPESSDNFNAGVAYKKGFENHSFGVQGNFIYRDAKDFIRIDATGVQAIYQNEYNVRVTGFDASLHYGYKNWLTVEVNATHQKTIDTNKFDPPGSNVPNYDNGSQLANVPIFYANASVAFNFRKIRTTDDNLMINLFTNYVDEYYLVSTRNGAPSSRNVIPEQLTQNIGASYAFQNGKYNIGLECNNVADTKVYDYFKVQKPGRSFIVKLRYFLN
ncbi:TonB-dependent receptor [Flavobacterium ginsenosidimutans]|uniref:TonB-dependent receptor n=1 Tax=Flavobacterium ginsenosidimutans TaxID=687844 RepID=UPI000DAE9A0F|nr:TonB-dependent receptor [Flavobacterium ginsenosidimutans]KAF2329627.1 TonB-dependent receptor [Flavobacterium ginsenosidimutans]